MSGTSEDYSGRNEAHVANRYWTRVKEGNSKVDIGHAQEMGVESKVKCLPVDASRCLILCASQSQLNVVSIDKSFPYVN